MDMIDFKELQNVHTCLSIKNVLTFEVTAYCEALWSQYLALSNSPYPYGTPCMKFSRQF